MTTVNIILDNGLVRETAIGDVYELKIKINPYQGGVPEVEYVVDDCYRRGIVSWDDAKKIQKSMLNNYQKIQELNRNCQVQPRRSERLSKK